VCRGAGVGGWRVVCGGAVGVAGVPPGVAEELPCGLQGCEGAEGKVWREDAGYGV